MYRMRYISDSDELLEKVGGSSAARRGARCELASRGDEGQPAQATDASTATTGQMEQSPAWKPPPPPEHSTAKRRQRSLSPRPQDYHPARIRKVAWPRDAPKPSEAELRATFSRLAPVANVGVGTSNAAIVVFTTCEGAQKAQDDYQGLWRVSTPKVSHEEATKTLRVMKAAAPVTPVNSPPHSRSPSRSRSPRRRRRSGSFDLQAGSSTVLLLQYRYPLIR